MHTLTFSYLGGGLPLHMFDRTHTPFLTKSNLVALATISSKIGTAPESITMSRYLAQSPAILPRHHMVWWQRSWTGLISSCTKRGTMPWSITILQWSCVPLAMLVRAQTDSICSCALSCRYSSAMNLGNKFALMISWIGGSESSDKSFLKPKSARSLSVSESDSNSRINSGIKLTLY